MTDYLEEIKERVNKEDRGPTTTWYLNDLQYLIRRLEEREHTVKKLRAQLKGLKRSGVYK